MKLTRIYVAFVLLCFQSIRLLDAKMFYSDEGVLPVSVLLKILPPEMARFSILDTITSGTGVLIFHFLYWFILLALLLGTWPRIMAAIAFVMHLSIAHRNPAVVYGMDLVSTYLLFSLALSKYGPSKIKFENDLSSMARRLLQIQVCIVYAYSGLEKVRGLDWWRGEALWGMLVNPLVARFDYAWTLKFPFLLVVLPTYFVLLWEIYFPVLIWFKPLRPYFLLFGVVVHLAIAFSVTIPFFGLIMIGFYAAFLDDEIIDKFDKRLNGTLLHKLFSLKY